MEDIKEKIEKCKSFSEVGRLLGYSYYNAKVKKEIIKLCSLYGIDIIRQVGDYVNRKVYCLNCGKEITGNDRFRKKFCCSSCATSYNNKKRSLKTEEEKKKISDSMKNYLLTNTRKRNNFNLISECVNNGLILNPYNVEYEDMIINTKKYTERTCIVCGNTFKPFINKNGHLYKGSTCSEKCNHELKKQKGIDSYKRIVSEGRFKGWQSRNILSYPEKFWADVLNTNGIDFISNKSLKHENSNYFLDFYIEIGNRKIDLEIDGKQHKYEDRIKSDKERDIFVLSNNIEVYRIDWNEINSEKGKQLMKDKIDKFLTFIDT